MDETTALVILNNLPLIGPVKTRLLLTSFGSASKALNSTKEELQSLPGFGPKICDSILTWQNNSSWEKDLKLIEQYNVQLLPYTSSLYPKSLKELPDSPILLYYLGSLTTQDQNSLAVIGTRNASIYGKEMSEKISRDLVHQGFTVVSGLARGIDTAAHSGAIKGQGRTLAVIGSGLSHIYPAENVELARKIVENGAVITEFPMHTRPDRQNFPQRNRIVSGMTRGTLLIEAPIKSGAMITMQRAKAQNRKLFALPGRADMETFQGNHSLIKRGEAELVEGAEDIIDSFSSLFSLPKTTLQEKPPLPPLEEEEKILLSQLPGEELTMDQLVERSQLPIHKLNVLLMSLVLKRVIKEFPGRIYKKVQ